MSIWLLLLQRLYIHLLQLLFIFDRTFYVHFLPLTLRERISWIIYLFRIITSKKGEQNLPSNSMHNVFWYRDRNKKNQTLIFQKMTKESISNIRIYTFFANYSDCQNGVKYHFTWPESWISFLLFLVLMSTSRNFHYYSRIKLS